MFMAVSAALSVSGQEVQPGFLSPAGEIAVQNESNIVVEHQEAHAPEMGPNGPRILLRPMLVILSLAVSLVAAFLVLQCYRALEATGKAAGARRLAKGGPNPCTSGSSGGDDPVVRPIIRDSERWVPLPKDLPEEKRYKLGGRVRTEFVGNRPFSFLALEQRDFPSGKITQSGVRKFVGELLGEELPPPPSTPPRPTPPTISKPLAKPVTPPTKAATPALKPSLLTPKPFSKKGGRPEPLKTVTVIQRGEERLIKLEKPLTEAQVEAFGDRISWEGVGDQVSMYIRLEPEDFPGGAPTEAELDDFLSKQAKAGSPPPVKPKPKASKPAPPPKATKPVVPPKPAKRAPPEPKKDSQVTVTPGPATSGPGEPSPAKPSPTKPSPTKPSPPKPSPAKPSPETVKTISYGGQRYIEMPEVSEEDYQKLEDRITVMHTGGKLKTLFRLDPADVTTPLTKEKLDDIVARHLSRAPAATSPPKAESKKEGSKKEGPKKEGSKKKGSKEEGPKEEGPKKKEPKKKPEEGKETKPTPQEGEGVYVQAVRAFFEKGGEEREGRPRKRLLLPKRIRVPRPEPTDPAGKEGRGPPKITDAPYRTVSLGLTEAPEPRSASVPPLPVNRPRRSPSLVAQRIAAIEQKVREEEEEQKEERRKAPGRRRTKK